MVIKCSVKEILSDLIVMFSRRDEQLGKSSPDLFTCCRRTKADLSFLERLSFRGAPKKETCQ